MKTVRTLSLLARSHYTDHELFIVGSPPLGQEIMHLPTCHLLLPDRTLGLRIVRRLGSEANVKPCPETRLVGLIRFEVIPGSETLGRIQLSPRCDVEREEDVGELTT